jgi:nickel-dependent lactate racemase
MKDQYYLQTDRKKTALFSLPEEWVCAHFVRSETGEQRTPSVEQMLRDALAHLDDAVQLRGSASLSQKVAIIVDDLTRPTPVTEILGILLPYLDEKGYASENVTIVVALGTHPSLTEDQLEKRLGRTVLSSHNVIQHDAWQSDLVPVKVAGSDRVVRINPAVAHADLRIGVSSILPHPMAGFGGGPKIVFPGVADFDSIKVHHPKNVLHPRAVVGVTKGNPFHEEIAAVARSAGLHLSINCVYDAGGAITNITAGSPENAFAKAVELCFEKLGHRFEDKVDVTIASVFPHVHGNQLLKGLMPAAMVTKEGGGVLLFAPLEEPIPAEFLNSIKRIREASRNKPAEYIRKSLERGEAFLPDKPMDYNMAMTNVFIRPEMRVVLVSENVSQEEASTMGMEHASSLEEGLARLKESFPRARAAIFPAGGLIVPIMS